MSGDKRKWRNGSPTSLIYPADDEFVDQTTRSTTMFAKTKIALSAALIFSAASAALAGGPDMDDRIKPSEVTHEVDGSPRLGGEIARTKAAAVSLMCAKCTGRGPRGPLIITDHNWPTVAHLLSLEGEAGQRVFVAMSVRLAPFFAPARSPSCANKPEPFPICPAEDESQPADTAMSSKIKIALRSVVARFGAASTALVGSDRA
jgi:hypothetical protein